jgi:hypothetical protein
MKRYRKPKYEISEEYLKQKYLVEKLSTIQIAKEVGCRPTTIAKRLESYGIARREQREAQVVNIVGNRYERLTVDAFSHTKDGNAYWLCECRCGNKVIRPANGLKAGHIKSCGCLKVETGTIAGRKTYRGGKYIRGEDFGRIRKNATKRGLEFNIAIQDIEAQIEKQNFKCAITNRPLTFNSRKIQGKTIYGNCSVDRKDSNKGYTVENIQIVDKQVNIAKHSLTQEEFIQLCKEVVEHNK